MLYNANLDRSKQKRQSAAELRKEVLKWEQRREKDAKKPAVIVNNSREHEVMSMST
jgi:ribosomal protein S25